MSSNDIAIKVENISKRYRIGLKENMHDSIGSAIFDFIKSPLKNYRKYRSLYKFDDINSGQDQNPGNSPSDIIWALRDVSFEVRKGEVLGIIGRNGSGKSTLLKVLSKITEPTSGSAEIRGRVSSLLEVGTGFHPELTGRENVYLNGTILGMTKKEVDRKFDEIVDFSGVKKFIDTPVKRYSSGMKVRLAFAVAAHLEPEIMIVDEVLAVGDAEFQKKCLGKMHDISSKGRTVLFVSHNMSAIIDLCPTSIVLQDGSIFAMGRSKETVERYLSALFSPANNLDLRNAPVHGGDGRLQFVSVYLQNGNDKRTSMPIAGHPVDIVLEFVSREELSHVRFILTIFNQMGIAVTSCNVEASRQQFHVPKGEGRIICHIAKLPLPFGNYKIAVAANDKIGELDRIPTACIFDVEVSNFFPTKFVPSMRYSTSLIEHSWKLIPERVEVYKHG
jgi:lipopolysaccharide transport system ATP-binding protein